MHAVKIEPTVAFLARVSGGLLPALVVSCRETGPEGLLVAEKQIIDKGRQNAENISLRASFQENNKGKHQT